MFTEEFKKACEACKSEEEFKAVIDLHKSELTEEELQQVSGGAPFPVNFNFFAQWGDYAGRCATAKRNVVKKTTEKTAKSWIIE